MHLRIRRIIKLLQQISLRDGCHQLLCQLNGTSHSIAAWGELQFSAIGPKHGATLCTHRVRHGENEAIASGGSHHGQGDPSVATGGFHQHGAPRSNGSSFLRCLNHGPRDAVFNRGSGVEAFQLGQHLRMATTQLWQAIQPHYWGSANQGRDVRSNGHKR